MKQVKQGALDLNKYEFNILDGQASLEKEIIVAHEMRYKEELKALIEKVDRLEK